MSERGKTRLPYIQMIDDDGYGGMVVALTAAAALNTGDAVFLSAAHTVNKSTTAADYLALVGVVVGGAQLNDGVTNETGLLAANANEEVLVLVGGVAKCVADSAITLGTLVTAGVVVAGRVDDAVITTDLVAGDNGKILGLALTTAANAGDAIDVLVAIR